MVAELLIGLGIGQTTAPSTTLIMASVRMSKSGVGSAVNDVSRELGGALGIAVLGSVLNTVYRSRVSSRLPPGLPPAVAADARRSVADALLATTNPHSHIPPNLVGQLVAAVRTTFASGFGLSMLCGACMLVLCSGMVWVFQQRGLRGGRAARGARGAGGRPDGRGVCSRAGLTATRGPAHTLRPPAAKVRKDVTDGFWYTRTCPGNAGAGCHGAARPPRRPPRPEVWGRRTPGSLQPAPRRHPPQPHRR